MLAQYFDILVLLVVVLVIFQKLRGVLGTRPSESEKTQVAEEEAAKIFDMIVKEVEDKKSDNKNSKIFKIVEEYVEAEAENVSETDLVLKKIPNFSKSNFMDGAQKAFEIIVESFAKGDVETLEMLVSNKLLKKFQEIIEFRKSEGMVAETEFIVFDKAEILSAKIDKNEVAKIVVEFISQQVNLIKNKEGEVIEGDDQYIQTITDIWTFERALTSSNLNWILVSTKK